MAQVSKREMHGIEVSIEYKNGSDAPVSEKEIEAYIARARELYPTNTLEWLKLEVDGEDVGISYGLAPVPFDRIRRITGYLVGTMDRWNNAKGAEEHDRVKHGVDRTEAAFACSNGC